MEAGSTQPLERIPADFMQNPYEILEKYRDQGPAHEVIFAHGAKVWLVTRYDEIRALVSDPRVSKDGRRMNELFARHSGAPVEEQEEDASVGFDEDLATHMLNSDPPRHTRLRTSVSKRSPHNVWRETPPRIEQVRR